MRTLEYHELSGGHNDIMRMAARLSCLIANAPLRPHSPSFGKPRASCAAASANSSASSAAGEGSWAPVGMALLLAAAGASGTAAASAIMGPQGAWPLALVAASESAKYGMFEGEEGTELPAGRR